MKKISYLIMLLLLIGTVAVEGCGPVVISSRPEKPMPPWFYPNRIEMVRYVYFPDYMLYYDLSLRNYIYLDNNVWVRVNVLPPRYRTIDLRRSKFVHIKTFRGDNIGRYHRENNRTRGRSKPRRPRRPINIRH